ncbi:MAG TPA: hypothetical protein VFH48_37295 [Chloroflexota bacterium]|nr:hypothetical protein [Chloroflexota bacterium]
MDEQAIDVMSNETALEGQADDQPDLGDAAQKKGEGFMSKEIDL